MDCHYVGAQDNQKIASQQRNLHQFSDCTKRTSAVNAQQQNKSHPWCTTSPSKTKNSNILLLASTQISLGPKILKAPTHVQIQVPFMPFVLSDDQVVLVLYK